MYGVDVNVLLRFTHNIEHFTCNHTGAVAVAVGFVFLRGSGRLQAVVKTKGDDVAHLMAALTSLGRAFLVQVVTSTVAFFIGAVAAGLVAAGLVS